MRRYGMDRIIAGTLLLLSAASPAVATTTVFDNFGPDWDYNWGLGWSIAGVESENDYGVEQAMGFVPTTSGNLCDLWLAIAYVPFDPGEDVVTLRLTTDDDGRPGVVLEEWVFTEFGTWSQWNPPLHAAGSGDVLLEEGTRYWLWAIPADPTWTLWDLNNTGDVGPHTLRREGEDWLPVGNETRGVFRVDVTDPAGAPVAPDMAPRLYLTAGPNPSHGPLDIHYAAPHGSAVRVEVLDPTGRRLRTWEAAPGGLASQTLHWDGCGHQGRRLPAGAYWVRLLTRHETCTTRIVIVD